MTCRFRVAFSGLCTFVPEQPDPGRPWERVGVLISQLLMPKLTANKAAAIPPHLGYVVCRLGDIAASSQRDPDLVFGARSSDFALYRFRGEDLSIESDSSDRFDYLADSQVVGSTVTKNDAQDLHWVANMTNICPSNRVLPNIINKPAKQTGLAARLMIDRGLLRVSFIDSNVQWTATPCDKNMKPYSQPMAQETSLDFTANKVTLKSTAAADLIFACKSGSETTITIGVTPAEDIFMIGDEMDMGIDRHFELYADLIKDGHPHDLVRAVTVWQSGNCPNVLLAPEKGLW